MKKLMSVKILKSKRGASMIEYSLLLALIAVICIAGVKSIGQKTNCAYVSIAMELMKANGINIANINALPVAPAFKNNALAAGCSGFTGAGPVPSGSGSPA